MIVPSTDPPRVPSPGLPADVPADVPAQTPAESDKRTALISAALTILDSDGPAALTVRSITARAGCSTTGIYTHFGGKHGLVEAIFLEGFDSFDAATEPALAAGDLPAAGRAYRQWALDHPTQYMVMFGRAVPDYTPSDVALGRALASFGALAAAVRRLTPDADGTDDADLRAYHVFATVHGYVMLELAQMSAATSGEPAAMFERALDALST